MTATSKSKPDMSVKQYLAALKRHGFTNAHFGYLYLPAPLNHIQVFAGHGGERLRDRLAYVLGEWSRIQKLTEH